MEKRLNGKYQEVVVPSTNPDENDKTLRIPLYEGEEYLNSRDRTIRVGRYNLQQWTDIVTAVERSMMKILTQPGLVCLRGSKTRHGIVPVMAEEHKLSMYLVERIIEEGSRFKVIKTRAGIHVVRIL